MKIRNQSKLFFAGMLVTTPSLATLLTSNQSFAQTAITQKASAKREAVYLSKKVLQFKDFNGNVTQVLAGVRVVKNNNTPDRGSFGSCSPTSSPDSVTIFLIDANTKKEFGTLSGRWFGNVQIGNVDLERSESAVCTGGKQALSLTSSSLQFKSLQSHSSEIFVAGVYDGGKPVSVQISNDMVFDLVSLK